MSAGSQRGVLIVEDEEELRSLFVLVLEMEDFLLFQAEDGQSALDMLTAHKGEIDVMITDLGMPNIGGVELITRARSIKPALKIIGTSGLSGRDIEENVRSAGADAFIAKPFSPHDAIKQVKELMERS